jgi:hypothetical protein
MCRSGGTSFTIASAVVQPRSGVRFQPWLDSNAAPRLKTEAIVTSSDGLTHTTKTKEVRADRYPHE